jgi:hypothetical protein
MTDTSLTAQADAFSAEPDMLVMFRTLPRRVQHQFIQLAIDEMELDGEAERAADSFLASSAWVIEDRDEYRASELYPQGCLHRQTWLRHKIACADEIIRLERRALGRTAMLKPRTKACAPRSFE